jgi:hypothetical protein
LLLSLYGKLQKYKPIKVDKTILTWKGKKLPPQVFRFGRGGSWCMMIDKGVDDVLIFYT